MDRAHSIPLLPENDQAVIEKKNGAIVRKLLGYSNFRTMGRLSALDAFGAVVRMKYCPVCVPPHGRRSTANVTLVSRTEKAIVGAPSPTLPWEEGVIGSPAVFCQGSRLSSRRTPPEMRQTVGTRKGAGYSFSRGLKGKRFMKLTRMISASACALVAALALSGIAVQAATGTTGESTDVVLPIDIAQGADTDPTVVVVKADPRVVPPMEAAAHRAAAEGKTQLRRYISRTQGIYNYYYWNFAKHLPAE